MRKILSILLSCLLLTGCAGELEPVAVFDPRTVQEAASLPAASVRQLTSQQDFTNPDGDARFHVSIDSQVNAEPLPVLEVIPGS